MRLQAILFDLDGTLLNRRETFRCHLESQRRRHRELFSTGQAGDIDRMMVIDDNGNCPRADFIRRSIDRTRRYALEALLVRSD